MRTFALLALPLCTDQEANGHGAGQTKDGLADEQHWRRWKHPLELKAVTMFRR